MKEFQYTIRDEIGIHARPAGQLAKLAKSFPDTTITIARGSKKAKASQLMALMGMGIKCGETVTVTAEGPSEDAAFDAMKAFFEENL